MVERSHKPTSIAPSTRAPQPTVTISDDSSQVTAQLPSGESVQILLFGATVLSWKNKDGSENLFLSEAAALNGSAPVRGGIPVVFPVFGAPPKEGHPTSALPSHGFARQSRWEYLGKSTSESTSGGADNGVKLDFGLYSSALSDKFKTAWPYDFGLVYSVTLTPEGLRTVLNVRNEGDQSFEFQVLFHTYFRVKDVTTARVTGLAGVQYVDKVLNKTTHTQSTPEIAITGETDRVYAAVPQDTTSIVEAGKPRFDVVRDNLPDVVVWNPWKEKAQGIADFAPKEAYSNMLCVETGAVEGWQKLDGGESWEGGQTLKSLL